MGIHLTSGKRSYFCENDISKVNDIKQFLNNVTKYSLENVKRIIGAYNVQTENALFKKYETKEIAIDYSKLSNFTDSIRTVLEGCNLMKYLVQKAMITGYLSHFERLSVLHVFGHIGEDGKEFVHTVMSFTLNYQYNVTQKFILKMPQKPVSCIKLREQYKQVTAEYGCSCIFKRTKDCYPSPVIHAIKNNNDSNHNITIPISRTISKTKQEKVYEDLNEHNKVQELATKIVELKKQYRGIDKAVNKVERELCQIYDNAGVDCMEVDMGMLIRRKKNNGYEWLIEI